MTLERLSESASRQIGLARAWRRRNLPSVNIPILRGSARNPKARLNWVLSDILRWVLCRWLELRARLTGRGYYCAALHGLSEYNITINSDRTVSCNCQDYEGIGHIGDLRQNTFEEIFFGPVAERFRRELQRGKMPIPTCARCGDLKRLPSRDAPPPPVRLPYRGVLLENTVRCNVDCTGCARGNAAAIRVNRQVQMPLAELEQTAELLARLGLKQIFFLNLGEPFLSPTITQELPLLRQKNPHCRIVTSTNGMLLDTDAKREAALNFSHILFSVHGINDAMCRKYMRGGSFTRAYAAMKAMAEYRNARGLTQPILEWKYLLFNWNDRPEYLERAIELAREAKLDFISFWPTNNPFYGISWRYRLGLLNRFGRRCWKGLELDLRPEGLRGTPTHPYFVEFPEAA